MMPNNRFERIGGVEHLRQVGGAGTEGSLMTWDKLPSSVGNAPPRRST